MILKNTTTLKSGSEVTQGHRNWYHSIACLCVL